MINQLIEFSIKNRFFIILITALLIGLGFKSFQNLSIDAVPDITNTQVQINTAVKGLVPEEVERMVTFPIEYSMNGIPGVENIRSISKYGISQVTVIFKEGSSILEARQLATEKLRNLSFPVDVKPELGPISTGLGEIFHYSIEAKELAENEEARLLQLMELKSLQDWFIKPRLLTVKGVTEVNTIGAYQKQYYIQPKIDVMAKYGIHFDDIENAISQTNVNVGGGYIQQTGEQLLVRGVGLLEGIEDIENIIVKRLSTYKIIKLKDIAKVGFDKEIRTGAATVNGKESIIGTAFMLLGENSRTVSTRVAQKLSEIEKDLPDWVQLNVIYDRSQMVNQTLNTVQKNLIFGAVLVSLFLILLVGDLRAAVITSIIIPISLLITFILMKWQNISGNLMSLGALDFGIIVDGAVIVIENCVRRINERAKLLGRDLSSEEIKETVSKATIEIRSAAGFGELIVIIVFLPLFALTGIEGKMFGPMASTFIFALASALVLSFTLVPALASIFLKSNRNHKAPITYKFFESLFTPLFRISVKFRKLVVSIGLLVTIASLFLFSKLGAEFIPQLDEGDFAIQFIRPANISLENSVHLQSISERIIKKYPQVHNVFARTGAAEVSTDPMGVNISDTYVMLKDKKDWPEYKNIKNKNELISKIKEELELSVPAQVLLISQPVELRFNELLEGTRTPIAVKIYGDSLELLDKYSKQIESIIKEIVGAGEVESESKGKSPMLLYSPKKEELAQLGVSAKPVLEAIEIAIGGRQVGSIYEGVKSYPIVTRLSSEERKDFNIVKNLPVGISNGYTVPIEQVAEVNFVETYTQIKRENSQRRVAVLVKPETRDMESFVLNAMSKVNDKIQLPAGYFIEWGGSFKNLQSAKDRLSILVPIALVLILALLYTAFKSFSHVLLIFLCAPMSLIGGVTALLLMKMPFSISAGVGFIALSGISILNGVVLVSYFNRLSVEGMGIEDIIQQGVMARFRPVLMTALTDIFGFLPMMFSTGLGSEVQKPLATVVVGGMLSATFLTLILLPNLYGLFNKYLIVKKS